MLTNVKNHLSMKYSQTDFIYKDVTSELPSKD